MPPRRNGGAVAVVLWMQAWWTRSGTTPADSGEMVALPLFHTHAAQQHAPCTAPLEAPNDAMHHVFKCFPAEFALEEFELGKRVVL